jgi:hypothetical protein
LTRPPLDEVNGGWSYGVSESYLPELVAYWRDGYGWRQAEAGHFIPWENPDAWVNDLRRTSTALGPERPCGATKIGRRAEQVRSSGGLRRLQLSCSASPTTMPSGPRT